MPYLTSFFRAIPGISLVAFRCRAAELTVLDRNTTGVGPERSQRVTVKSPVAGSLMPNWVIFPLLSGVNAKPYSQASADCSTVSMLIEDSLKKSKKGLSPCGTGSGPTSSLLQKKSRQDKQRRPVMVRVLDFIIGDLKE